MGFAPQRVGIACSALPHGAIGIAGAGLHLLGHGLAALAQGLQRAALGVHGLAAPLLTLAQLAFGLLHGALGVLQVLVALHAQFFHAALQLVEALAQGLLPLLQGLLAIIVGAVLILVAVVLIALLALLAGLPLLHALLAAILLALRLIAALLLFFVAEGVIAQLLLVAGHLVEFVQRLVHLAGHGVRAPLALGGPQIFEQVLQLLHHLLGFGHLPVAHHLLDAVEHGLEILRGDGAGIVIVGAALGLLIAPLALGLLGQFVQELVQRRPHLVHQFADLVLGRAPVEGVAQVLLGGAQIPLGVAEAAILDAQRHLPHEIGHPQQIRILAGAGQTIGDVMEAQIDPGGDAELVGGDHQALDGGEHTALGVRRQHQIAPLLHQRPRQRLHEWPLGKGDLHRVAQALVAALVLGREGHGHNGSRPGMF